MILEKKSIQNLNHYQTKDVPYIVKLDANEGKNILFPNGFDLSQVDLHIYPDDQATLLKNRLSEYLKVPKTMIVEGNGSSELIELLIKTYVELGETVLGFEPTFSMYRIYAEIHGVNYKGIPSNPDFSVDIGKMIEASQQYAPKIIFLCSPNNPTGYQLKREEILKLMNKTEAIVVVDEAYIEFADRNQSVLKDVGNYPNLVILRTFSKAFGLAAIRLGYLVGPESIASSISKVKSPYHLNALTQAIGAAALTKTETMEAWIQTVLSSREAVIESLQSLCIQTYQASGNFVWIKSDIDQLSNQLESKGILIRAYGNTLKGYYRITIGTPSENESFINALKEIIYG